MVQEMWCMNRLRQSRSQRSKRWDSQISPVCMAKNQYSLSDDAKKLEDRRILISISEKSASVPVQDSLSL